MVQKKKKLTPSTNEFQGLDADSLQISFVNHLEYSCAKDEFSATQHDLFTSAWRSWPATGSIERWIETQQAYYAQDAKRVYYLSLEFLMGRALGNSLINLDLYDNAAGRSRSSGYDLEELRETEWDAGLGNGGLGRLAACFMDSMATLELPAYGYGIRYEYGIFFQKIIRRLPGGDAGQLAPLRQPLGVRAARIPLPGEVLRHGEPVPRRQGRVPARLGRHGG